MSRYLQAIQQEFIPRYAPLPAQELAAGATMVQHKQEQAVERLDSVQQLMNTAQVAPIDKDMWGNKVEEYRQRIASLSEDGAYYDKMRQVTALAREFQGVHGAFEENRQAFSSAMEGVDKLKASSMTKSRMRAAMTRGYQGIADEEGGLTNRFSGMQFNDEANLHDIAVTGIKRLPEQVLGDRVNRHGFHEALSGITEEQAYHEALNAIHNDVAASGHLQNEAMLYMAENPGATPEEAMQHVNGMVDSIAREAARQHAVTNRALRNMPADGDGSGKGKGANSVNFPSLVAMLGGATGGRKDTRNLQEYIADIDTLTQKIETQHADLVQGLARDGLELRDDGVYQNGVKINHDGFALLEAERHRLKAREETITLARDVAFERLKQQHPDVIMNARGEIELPGGNIPTRNSGFGPIAFGMRVPTGSTVEKEVQRKFNDLLKEELNHAYSEDAIARTEFTFGRTGQDLQNVQQMFNNMAVGGDSQFASGADKDLGQNITSMFTQGDGRWFGQSDGEYFGQPLEIISVGLMDENGKPYARVNVRDKDGKLLRSNVIVRGNGVENFISQMTNQDSQRMFYGIVMDRLAADVRNRNEQVTFTQNELNRMRVNSDFLDQEGNRISSDIKPIKSVNIERGQTGHFLTVEFSDGTKMNRQYHANLSDLIKDGFGEMYNRATSLVQVGGINIDHLLTLSDQGELPRQYFSALIGQESGGNYSAENDRTGALGLTQILPSNIPQWTEQHLGRRMTPEEFARDPQAQMEVSVKENNFQFKRFLAAGNPPTVAMRMALAKWYSGDENAHLSDAPLWKVPGRRRAVRSHDRPANGVRLSEPTVKDYVDSVMRRIASN
jgi:hypothetical protein